MCIIGQLSTQSALCLALPVTNFAEPVPSNPFTPNLGEQYQQCPKAYRIPTTPFYGQVCMAKSYDMTINMSYTTPTNSCTRNTQSCSRPSVISVVPTRPSILHSSFLSKDESYSAIQNQESDGPAFNTLPMMNKNMALRGGQGNRFLDYYQKYKNISDLVEQLSAARAEAQISTHAEAKQNAQESTIMSLAACNGAEQAANMSVAACNAAEQATDMSTAACNQAANMSIAACIEAKQAANTSPAYVEDEQAGNMSSEVEPKEDCIDPMPSPLTDAHQPELKSEGSNAKDIPYSFTSGN